MNIVAAGTGRPVPLGDQATFLVKEDGSHTRGNLLVAEMVVQPGFATPLQHVHHAHEEAWFILEGELEFTSGTRVQRVGPGGWVLVPIGIAHTFSNPGTTATRFIATMTPNLYLNYFYEMGEHMARAARESSGVTEEARARITSEVMSRYQTEVVDPVAWERDVLPTLSA